MEALGENFKHWLVKTQKVCEEFNYKILDLIFWEHREGCWQAQNQIESDFLFEVFVPYSNRAILDLMLSLPNDLRGKKSYSLQKDDREKLEGIGEFRNQSSR